MSTVSMASEPAASSQCLHPSALQTLPRWVTWWLKARQKADGTPGKLTKVPHNPTNARHAKADDASTWGSHAAALDLDRRRDRSIMGGIGIELGDLGDGTFLCGIDLDTCRDPETGELTAWAEKTIERASTYM